MGGHTYMLMPLSKKEAYEEQFKTKKSYKKFVGRTTQTRVKTCLFIEKYLDVPSYVVDWLVFSLSILSLNEKNDDSTNSRTNLSEERR